MREKEADINCLTSSGLPQPLGRIQRVHKWKTDNLIPDDGFREMKTINQAEIQNPQVHRVKEQPTLRMINKYNIAELSLVDRPIQGTRSGFGSVINRHEQNHDQRFFSTTNHDFMGKPEAAIPYDKVNVQGVSQAGGHMRAMEDQKIKTLTALCGEVDKQMEADPQERTDVQRSWMYGVDGGVKHVRQGPAKPQKQPFDNALSLPLGDGVY